MSRQFPIMDEEDARRRVPLKWQVPWALLAPHERQALSNHGQTLERLAERGGLGPSEALAVIEGRRWRKMEVTEARAKLRALVEAWTVANSRAT